MSTRDTAITYYSMPTRILHWMTAILVLVAFIYGPGGSEERIYSAARDFDRQLHETLGICVFVLLVIRVVWRAFDKHPQSPPVAPWMSTAATTVQIGLYILLFAVPFTAASGAWLEGHDLTLLGGLVIPAPVAKSHALGATIAEVHTWLGDTILWLAGAHACAGLFHHFIMKDNVLSSMLLRRNSSR